MSGVGAIDQWLTSVIRGACNSAPSGSSQQSGPDRSFKFDNDAVWSRIEYHGIAPFLFAYSPKDHLWPDELWQSITERARIAALWEATHQNVTATIVEALAKRGIVTLFLKGTALAYDLYAAPSLRSRGDSDLLVDHDSVEKTREILREHGWSRYPTPHGVYYQESWEIQTAQEFRHIIDLHWQASDRPLLQSILKLQDLRSNPREISSLSKNALCPSLPFTLIHCVVNQHWHYIHGYYSGNDRIKGSHRLIWLYDMNLISRAMDRSDWESLIDLCEKYEIGSLIADWLHLAEKTLGTPLPAKHVGKLSAITLHEDIAQLLAVQDNLEEFWHDLRTTRSWRGRGRLLTNRALPPRLHLIEKYPQAAHWPTIVLQVRSAMSTAKRAIHRALGS